MKHIIIVFSLISLHISLLAQVSSKNILGVWQYESSEIGSAWLDTYQFYSDGTFIFNLSQYDEIKRIIAIKGHYRLVNDSIYFKIEYATELSGGRIIRDNLTKIHGSWALHGSSIQKDILQPVAKEEYASIKFCKEVNCMLIDGRKFYRVNNDPKKYP